MTAESDARLLAEVNDAFEGLRKIADAQSGVLSYNSINAALSDLFPSWTQRRKDLVGAKLRKLGRVTSRQLARATYEQKVVLEAGPILAQELNGENSGQPAVVEVADIPASAKTIALTTDESPGQGTPDSTSEEVVLVEPTKLLEYLTGEIELNFEYQNGLLAVGAQWVNDIVARMAQLAEIDRQHAERVEELNGEVRTEREKNAGLVQQNEELRSENTTLQQQLEQASQVPVSKGIWDRMTRIRRG